MLQQEKSGSNGSQFPGATGDTREREESPGQTFLLSFFTKIGSDLNWEWKTSFVLATLSPHLFSSPLLSSLSSCIPCFSPALTDRELDACNMTQRCIHLFASPLLLFQSVMQRVKKKCLGNQRKRMTRAAGDAKIDFNHKTPAIYRNGVRL